MKKINEIDQNPVLNRLLSLDQNLDNLYSESVNDIPCVDELSHVKSKWKYLNSNEIYSTKKPLFVSKHIIALEK